MAFVSPLALPQAQGRHDATTALTVGGGLTTIRFVARPTRRAQVLRLSLSVQPPASVSLTPRVRFPSLAPDRFRHPIDVAATRVLQSVLGLEMVVAGVLRAAESAFELEHLSSGVLVGDRQMPKLHAALTDACAVLDLPVPALYVRQMSTPNAYTLAFQGRRPAVVVTTGLLELLDEAEVQAVLAHELGHLKCQHGLWLTAANLTLATLPMPRWAAEAASTALLRWQRAAELSCDRAALLVAQDEKVVLSLLMKLSGGAKGYTEDMDVEAFIRQADAFDKASSESAVGRAVSTAMVLAASHPLPIYRAREIRSWMQSDAFRSIIASGKPLTNESTSAAA